MSARLIRVRAGAGLVLAVLVAAGCSSSAVTASPASPSAATDREPWLLFNAFVGDDQKAAYLVRPDGMSVRQILTDIAGDVRAVSWSPDGTAIVFAFRDAANPDTSIWTATADGTGATKLYDGRNDGCGAVHYPAWSPDGTRLAFIC
jgi:hypothetical protein